MGLSSAIYEGSVRHRRFSEVEREFTYRVFMVYLDLAEVAEVMSIHPLWSTRPRSAASFRRSDYLGPSSQPLDSCVRDRVAARTGSRPDGPIRMLTGLRQFGLLENPVSFYYSFDRSGERLEAVLAEVTNTPWGDRHSYVVDGVARGGSVVSLRLEKAMHVSPLMNMDHIYELTFGLPGESLPVHIESEREGRTAFDATLSLTRTEIDRRSLSRVLLTYPPMSYRVLAGIYTQAAITWLRGARFHGRPATSGSEARPSDASLGPPPSVCPA